MPVAPSAVPISPDYKTVTAEGKPTGYEVPRALETDEIPGIVASPDCSRKTVLYFNKLGRKINEKIAAAKPALREQLCLKRPESSIELLLAHNHQ